MTMRLWLSFPLLAAFGCHAGDETAASPALTLEAYTPGPSAEWRPCADSKSCGLVGGRDSVRVRVSYEGLQFPADQWPDAPTAVLKLDGTAVEPALVFSSVGVAPGVPTFESDPYLLPARAVSDLAVSVEGASGYFNTISGYRVALVDPSDPVTATVTGCVDSPCKQFASGSGQTAHVEISSWLDPKTAISVRTFVDGSPASTVDSTFEGLSSEKRTARFDLPVPNVPVAAGSKRQWTLAFDTAGLDIAPVELDLIPPSAPTVTVTGTGCDSESCTEFAAGIGTASIDVKTKLAPGTKLELGSVVNGQELQHAEQVLTSTADGSSAHFDIDVPSVFLDAGKKQSWQLALSTDTFSFDSTKLTLVPPKFGAEFLECTTSKCEEAMAGGTLTLELSAPAAFAQHTVKVRILVDNVPQPDVLEIDLDSVETDTRYGYGSVSLPSAAGKNVIAKAYFGSDGYVVRVSASTH